MPCMRSYALVCVSFSPRLQACQSLLLVSSQAQQRRNLQSNADRYSTTHVLHLNKNCQGFKSPHTCVNPQTLPALCGLAELSIATGEHFIMDLSSFQLGSRPGKIHETYHLEFDTRHPGNNAYFCPIISLLPTIGDICGAQRHVLNVCCCLELFIY
jgi:hypothetical protein